LLVPPSGPGVGPPVSYTPVNGWLPKSDLLKLPRAAREPVVDRGRRRAAGDHCGRSRGDFEELRMETDLLRARMVSAVEMVGSQRVGSGVHASERKEADVGEGMGRLGRVEGLGTIGRREAGEEYRRKGRQGQVTKNNEGDNRKKQQRDESIEVRVEERCMAQFQFLCNNTRIFDVTLPQSSPTYALTHSLTHSLTKVDGCGAQLDSSLPATCYLLPATCYLLPASTSR